MAESVLVADVHVMADLEMRECNVARSSNANVVLPALDKEHAKATSAVARVVTDSCVAELAATTPGERRIPVVSYFVEVITSVERSGLTAYVQKLQGGLDTPLQPAHAKEVFWSWLGAFISILLIAYLDHALIQSHQLPVLVGSFGASAVLLFGVPESKLSQPRNFVGGQLVSVLVGIATRLAIPIPWAAAPVGMSLALVAMQVTRTVHPPGGATALLVCSAAQVPAWYGFKFAVGVVLGSALMLGVALVVNNLAAHRRYPSFWW